MADTAEPCAAALTALDRVPSGGVAKGEREQPDLSGVIGVVQCHAEQLPAHVVIRTRDQDAWVPH